MFTRDHHGGNLLGVHDGLLLDHEMQAIAAGLGYSETIFLGEPTDGVTAVRIFTPASELPFAGHPLVGATWHVAEPGGAAALRCEIGVVTGRRDGSDNASIEVEYLPPVEAVDPPSGTTGAWIARMPLAYEVQRLADPEAIAAYSAGRQTRPSTRLGTG